MAGEFPHGVAFQQALLGLMLREESVAFLGAKHLKQSYFESPAMGWMFSAIEAHVTDYGRPPTELVLHESLRKLDSTTVNTYWPTIDAIIRTPVKEPEFIGQQVVEFVRRNLFVTGFHASRSLYNQGKTDEAYDLMMRRMDEVQEISITAIDRSFYAAEFDDRMEKRRLYSSASHLTTFSTGIPELDQVLDGGLSIGEVGTWIAYAKIGKTAMLRELAFFAVRALRIPVYVAVLEGSREKWEAQLDAAFTGTLYLMIKRGEIDPETYRRLSVEFAELRDLMVIRGFTTGEDAWDVSVTHIVEDLKDLKARHGFVPKMCIIDYADLLHPRRQVDSEYQAGKLVYQDLIVLAGMGLAVWTACQAQRPFKGADEKEHILKGRDVADSYHKIRLATFYGSLNRTLEEKERKRLRIYAEEYRDNEAGRLVYIQTDQAHGRLVKSVLRGDDIKMSPEASEPEPTRGAQLVGS